MNGVIVPPKTRAPDWGVILLLLKARTRISFVVMAEHMGLSAGTLYSLTRGSPHYAMRWQTGDVIERWARANLSDEELERCGL